VDLGGLPIATGGLTELRRVVRADRPRHARAPEEETQTALRMMGIGVVIDLRSEAERVKVPSHLAGEPGVVHLHIPLGEDLSVPGRAPLGTLSDLYRNLLVAAGTTFVAVLEAISGHPRRTVLLHCRGGRDRTGLVAALLLLLAGVSTREVLGDHALVGRLVADEVQRRRERWVARSQNPAHFDRANTYETLALARVLTAMAKDHGDAAGYLRAYGMSRQSLTVAAAILS
jgi:protein-tyrosine phosphatase